MEPPKTEDRKNDIAFDRSQTPDIQPVVETDRGAYDGTAASKLRYMIDQAQGAMLMPDVVAALVRDHPDEHDQIFAVLQKSYGNGFVQQVMAALKAPATDAPPAPTPSTADAAPSAS